MGIIELIVMVMVVTILATTTLAAVAYAAFRLRDRRAPALERHAADEPVFFERIRFAPAEEPVEA